MSGIKGEEEMMIKEEVRRGPWSVEEDFTLMNYISLHGEGRWNSLARSAGTYVHFTTTNMPFYDGNLGLILRVGMFIKLR